MAGASRSADEEKSIENNNYRRRNTPVRLLKSAPFMHMDASIGATDRPSVRVNCCPVDSRSHSRRQVAVAERTGDFTTFQNASWRNRRSHYKSAPASMDGVEERHMAQTLEAEDGNVVRATHSGLEARRARDSQLQSLMV
jgi:hypothetical protein